MPATPTEKQALFETRAALDAATAAHQAAQQAILAKANAELADGDVVVLSDTPVPGVRKVNGKSEFVEIPPYVGA